MLNNIDYKKKINEYRTLNDEYHNTLIFHVGIDAGMFSEINNMLVAICYCYVFNIRFVLYADDSNFSGEGGWEELFIPFCELNHDRLNKYGNYRYKLHFRYKGVLLPNLLVRRLIFPYIIRKRNKARFLTQDVFGRLVSKEFLDREMKWDLFEIDGRVKNNFCKLKDVALVYNKVTECEIKRMVDSLNLPRKYYSIQIRGGDKNAEYDRLYDANYCYEYINNYTNDCLPLFVFTDDYENVEVLLKKSSQKIYTLTNQNEKGYFNEAFNRLKWNEKKPHIIKLLACIEICLASEVHFGYAGTCTDDFISNAKTFGHYVKMNTDDCLKNKDLKYYISKLLKIY